MIWRFGDLVLFLPFPPMRLPFVSLATKRGESRRIGVHAPHESTDSPPHPRSASHSRVSITLIPSSFTVSYFHLDAFGLVHYNHPPSRSLR